MSRFLLSSYNGVVIMRRQGITLAAVTFAWATLLLACGGAGTSSSTKKQSTKPATTTPERKPATAEPTQDTSFAEKKEPTTPSVEKKESIPHASPTEKKEPASLAEKKEPIPPPAEKKWPYLFVETKTEQSGHRNVMDIYAFDGDIDPTDLKAFCQERKEKSPAKVFYYVVIFDKASNAKFPSTPFTAGYGDDEGAMKHIRAIYCYNKLNGFSEVRHHSQNIWEHISTLEKI